MHKKRFGVSVPSKIAADLDTLSNVLNVDRSSLVSEAIERYIHDKFYLSLPHKCQGVMMIVSDRRKSVVLASIYEHYGDIIKTVLHSHLDDRCIEIVIIEGRGDEIAQLESALKKLRDVKVKYVPLIWTSEMRKGR